MVKIEITKNDGNQRLDRFLKKYLKNASLSYIYKLIRKDVKVNGKRAKADSFLEEGDTLFIYLEEGEVADLARQKKRPVARKQFKIAFEDDNILIAEKPFGLLTHGDAAEKKKTLINQVYGYLEENNRYDPAKEKTFAPAPANRLDRNTTGLVIFGKTAQALKCVNKALAEKGIIKKYYMTIVGGELKEPLFLTDKMEKDGKKNIIKIIPEDSEEGKLMMTKARPIETTKKFSLVEVELVTGRTHQIRAHLAQAGFPLIGDVKYGNPKINKQMKEEFQLTTQLLHAYRLSFGDLEEPLAYLKGKEITSKLPRDFERIKKQLFD